MNDPFFGHVLGPRTAHIWFSRLETIFSNIGSGVNRGLYYGDMPLAQGQKERHVVACPDCLTRAIFEFPSEEMRKRKMFMMNSHAGSMYPCAYHQSWFR